MAKLWHQVGRNLAVKVHQVGRDWALCLRVECHEFNEAVLWLCEFGMGLTRLGIRERNGIEPSSKNLFINF
jgi:hypothetical protein